MSFLSKHTGQTIENSLDLIQRIYPIGSIYISVSSTNPSEFLGGSWEMIQDRFLVAAGNKYAAGSAGGADTHNHTAGSISPQMRIDAGQIRYDWGSPTVNRNMDIKWKDTFGQGATEKSHKETISSTGIPCYGNTGDSSSLPPYLAVYMWKRIK